VVSQRQHMYPPQRVTIYKSGQMAGIIPFLMLVLTENAREHAVLTMACVAFISTHVFTFSSFGSTMDIEICKHIIYIT